MTQLFTQEARLLSELKHDNIIELFGSHISDKYHNPLSCFLILKRYAIDGFDFVFKHDVKNKTKKTMLLFYHIMKALQYLKENHIIHRDVKLDNCLGNEDQTQWCLSDFGFAMQDKTLSYSGSYSLITGTTGYMAPEILEMEIVYYQSDLYSWGMSILASYPVKTKEALLNNSYLSYQYQNIFFTDYPDLSTKYNKCIEYLKLEPKTDPTHIMSIFKSNPVKIADMLWQQQRQVFSSHPEQSSEMIEAFYTLLMPPMITASQKQYDMRGELDLFISYFEYILTQYQH